MTENNPTDIVICTPLRTAVGGYGGQFTSVPVQELAATVVRAVMERSGLQPEDVDDLILGQASPNGAAPALGRVVAL
ncbi:thiolase family protein, partial [Corynebacterium nasicanis]